MNKDEIKKALECCRNGCPIGDCPYYGIKDCDNNLFKDALDLITEQEKELVKAGYRKVADDDDEIVDSMKTEYDIELNNTTYSRSKSND